MRQSRSPRRRGQVALRRQFQKQLPPRFLHTNDRHALAVAHAHAVDSVRVRHRKGVPVICVKEPGRKLFLELAPESDLSAATWASTLTHLVRLARESSAFS